MIEQLTNHLWQSTVFALVAALLTVFFRKSRAQVRYWLWFSASIKFFVPFALLITLGRQLEWGPEMREVVSPAVSAAMVQISEPFLENTTLDLSALPSDATRVDWLRVVAPAVWAFGSLAIVLVRVRVWRRIRAAVRASTPFELSEVEIPSGVQVRISPGLLEPGVVGWWRPTLLLPADLERHLTKAQLKAVVAHEVTHIRRRDNVTAAVHMFAEALFWFHPVVWWIGARLVDERERACDEEVLRLFGEPETYAEGILAVCKRYVEAPLACVSGVSGSNIKKRIEAIMSNRIGVTLTFAGKTALAFAALVALVTPIVVGSVTPPLRQQSTPVTSAAIQSAATASERFEEVSIRPCSPESIPQAPPGARGGGGNSFRMTPGRTYVQCMTLATLIRTAYGYGPARLEFMNTSEGSGRGGRGLRFDNLYGLGMEDGLRVRGGPDWVRSDKYTIEAVADGAATAEAMQGPMLRELLERRFQLKVHIESEPIEAFELTVAPGGHKIKPMEAGACTREPSSDAIKAQRNGRSGPIMMSEAARLGVKPTCGTLYGGANGPNYRWEHVGQPDIGGIAFAAAAALDARVIDRTGIKGPIMIAWEFGADESTPGALQAMARERPGTSLPGWDAPASAPKAPSIFTVVERQFGLKLSPIHVPREFIIIDRVARPSAN
jgi:uncharacterized protein (TIGR03435 family)